jgi:hypothetical protein
MFLARTHERFVAGQAYVWPEYGAYLGPIVLILALLGVLLGGLDLWWLVVLLAFSGALMFGHAGKWAPWTVLKGHVFPFKEMRVPSRFRCEVTMFLALFAGVAVDRLGQRLRQAGVRYEIVDVARSTALALGLIGVGDLLGVGIDTARSAFTNPAEQAVEVHPRLHYAAEATALIDQPRRNVGRLACWEEWGFGAGAPLWTGDVAQVKAAGPEATIGATKRTPNTFSFDVEATAPARLLLDSSYDKSWRTTVGQTGELDKQLVLDVPPGKHHVLVYYRPRTFYPGVAFTEITLASVAVYFAWDARRRRRA